MEPLYLDTHVVVWLFSGELGKLSSRAKELIERSELLVSPMVVLELEFLYEIGRLTYAHDVILSSLAESIDLKICNLSFASIAKVSTTLNWTRDPFDRLIVAHAACRGEKMLSRDRKIREYFDEAVW